MKDSASIYLQDPDDLSLENAYRSLPRKGEIIINTVLANLSTSLEQLEQKGFIGMNIKAFISPGEPVHIRAYKGKQGPCYNTGRSARYMGTAVAALDDDHHLLLAGEEIPICEKTASLYALPSYGNHVHCSEAIPELKDKLKTDPELLDCDVFESTQEKLYELVRGKSPRGTFTSLLYPGPFKLLVLDDGTLIHRGRINSIPEAYAKKLQKNDGLFRIDKQDGRPYESFSGLYETEGPRCLLNLSPDTVLPIQDQAPDFFVLSQITRDFREKLLVVLKSRKDYFMLTGSNREDAFGCCPSDEVTLADQLVRAGILSSSREPASPDTCPLTLYAFRNEIQISDGVLKFRQDREFRQELRYRLEQKNRSNLKGLARWTLLAFVAATILLAIIRIAGSSSGNQDHELFTRLELSHPNTTAVVLFHYRQRCDQCLAMERYTRELLQDEFPGQLQRNEIQFRQMIIDLPGNRDLTERFGLVTSTPVIINFEGKKEDSIRVLDRSWELYNDETAFKMMLSKELNQMYPLVND
jgi:hypothetical protein